MEGIVKDVTDKMTEKLKSILMIMCNIMFHYRDFMISIFSVFFMHFGLLY